MTLPAHLTYDPTPYPAMAFEQAGRDRRVYRTLEYMADQDARYPHVEAPKREMVSDGIKVASVTPAKPRPTRACEHCGNLFEIPYPSSKQRFCSQSCGASGTMARKKPPVTLICGWCDQPFEVPYEKRNIRKACCPEHGQQLAAIKRTARAAARKAGAA